MRSDISAALAAGPADKPRLDIGQPHIIGPSLCWHLDRLAATMVCAVDQDAGRAAAWAHFAEADLLGAHGPWFRSRRRCANYQSLGVTSGGELLLVVGLIGFVSMAMDAGILGSAIHAWPAPSRARERASAGAEGSFLSIPLPFRFLHISPSGSLAHATGSQGAF
jgi:hypothetical protein